MTDAADKCIPSTSDCPDSNYNVPGWSDCASEKHALARDLDWIALGITFTIYSITQSTFILYSVIPFYQL